MAIVQNMTGAGGFIAANYMYNKGKPDGLTIVLQTMDKKHPELGKMDNTLDFAMIDEARPLIQHGILDTATITRC